MIRAPENIQTERLLLRRPARSDAQALFDSYTSDSEVTRTLLWDAHTAVEQAEDFLRRCDLMWDSGDALPYVIQLAEGDELIGMIEMRMERTTADMGYVLAKKVLGAGLYVRGSEGDGRLGAQPGRDLPRLCHLRYQQYCLRAGDGKGRYAT